MEGEGEEERYRYCVYTSHGGGDVSGGAIVASEEAEGTAHCCMRPARIFSLCPEGCMLPLHGASPAVDSLCILLGILLGMEALSFRTKASEMHAAGESNRWLQLYNADPVNTLRLSEYFRSQLQVSRAPPV